LVCDDGLFCSGTESCDPLSGCLPGADPCNDGDLCTIDSCDEASDTCSNQPDPGCDLPPVAVATGPQVACEGDLVELDGSQSYDPEGAELLYSWQQVAGTPVNLIGVDMPRCFFEVPEVSGGDQLLDFELTVNDGGGWSLVDPVSVQVRDGCGGPPVIDCRANTAAVVDIPYLFDLDACAGVVGSKPMLWSKIAGPPEFFIDANSGLITWVPAEAGTFPITFRATNSEGSDDCSFDVTVFPGPSGLPQAVAEIVPDSGIAPLDVIFDGSQSTPPTGLVLIGFRWNPGDGSPFLYNPIAPYLYQIPGAWTVELKVTDQLGLADYAENVVTVTDVHGNVPPTARIVASATEGEGSLTVNFSCDCNQGDSPIVAYRWDFSEGGLSADAAPAYTFTEGRYQVWLTVVDENGLGALDSQEIVVRREGQPDLEPPFCKASADPVSGAAPLNVVYIGEYWDLDGLVEEVSWVFSDDTSSEEAVVIKEHRDPGVYPAVFTATDADGLQCHDTVRVTVTSQEGAVPPEIVSSADAQAECEVPYTYDEDGKPTALGTVPILWSLGQDGLGAPEGLHVDGSDGTISWTPTPDQAGENLVALVATNSAGEDVQLFNIEVACQEEGSDKGCGCSKPAGSGYGAEAMLGIFVLLLILIRNRKIG
jgi:PKD repeat protein